ncbi:MAG: hypothetical protein A2939_05185 [Parcubacteria group bacterium RIFCSPLOWO2_01_FULL_48_18]|nr:MAG: hypothetical protein A2939_05185 [Parcubacteria group bacterium RIFCSPLOWO2_01_FULL_48_18]OHB22794.1 MAG: hypothetical protein A3J67_06200 [Parcubacteria group bacterium RIFCSPHIGHO2_02_FULL_48_10b]
MRFLDSLLDAARDSPEMARPSFRCTPGHVRGGAAHFVPPYPRRVKRGEDRIPLELFLEYTAIQEKTRQKPRLFHLGTGFFAVRNLG